MGNAASADVGAALPPAAASGGGGGAASPGASPGAAKLYRWVPAGRRGGGAWELASDAAGLRLYDAAEDTPGAPPAWRVELEGAPDAPDAPVSDDFSFEPRERRVTFVAPAGDGGGEDGGDAVWAVRFAAPAAFEAFLQRYNRALFENRYGADGGRDAAEMKIFGDAFAPRLETDASRGQWVEDMDVDEAPAPGELGGAPTPRRARAVDLGADGADGGGAAAAPAAIAGVLMGAGDRSYVLREDARVDVMRNVAGGVEDAGVGFAATPPPRGGRASGTPPPRVFSAAAAGGLTPPKALLLDGERRMAVLTPGGGGGGGGGTTLAATDLETASVVRTWAFRKDGADVPMAELAPDSKAAQLEGGHHTFLGLAANRLARWDMRAPGGAVQAEMASPPALAWAGGKDYARGARFSCMATSGAGYVAVGSDNGKLRLYSEKTLTQAKTAIDAGLGLPITAVDVTYDGRWALATTRSYLVAVKTTYTDAATGAQLCGFTSRMGGAAPAPRLLRLKAEDVARTRGAPLTHGRFTWITEAGRQERWVVATCGEFTVLWSFRAVKTAAPDVVGAGGLTACTTYALIPKGESVVDSVFVADRHARRGGGAAAAGGDEAAMVVVTKSKVFTAADDDEAEAEAEAEEDARGAARARPRTSHW